MTGPATVDAARRAAKQRRAAAKARRDAIEALPPSDAPPVVHACSCADLAGLVDAESADLILTDPPYERASLAAWEELGFFAAHALKPGGLLLALTGKIMLPDVIDRVRSGDAGGRLKWWWAVLWDMPTGRQTQIYTRRVMQTWKPVLGWTTAEQPFSGEVEHDRVTSTDREATVLHKWGQSSQGFVELARKWAKPGDLVIDPFVGAGTSGHAALIRGCRFVGADKDPEHAEQARQLLGLAAADPRNDTPPRRSRGRCCDRPASGRRIRRRREATPPRTSIREACARRRRRSRRPRTRCQTTQDPLADNKAATMFVSVMNKESTL